MATNTPRESVVIDDNYLEAIKQEQPRPEAEPRSLEMVAAHAQKQLDAFEAQALAATAETPLTVSALDTTDTDEVALLKHLGELKKNKKTLRENFMSTVRGLKDRLGKALSSEKNKKSTEVVQPRTFHDELKEQNKEIEAAWQQSQTEQALDRSDYDRAMVETNLRVLAKEITNAEKSGDTQLLAILQQEQAKERAKLTTDRMVKQAGVDEAYAKQMDFKEPVPLPSLEASKRAFLDTFNKDTGRKREMYVGKAMRELAQAFNRPDLVTSGMTEFKEEMSDLIGRMPLGAERAASEEKFEMMQRVFNPNLALVKPTEKMSDEDLEVKLKGIEENFVNAATKEEIAQLLRETAQPVIEEAPVIDKGAPPVVKMAKPVMEPPAVIEKVTAPIAAKEKTPSPKIEQFAPKKERLAKAREIDARLDTLVKRLYDPTVSALEKRGIPDAFQFAWAEKASLKLTPEEIKNDIQMRWQRHLEGMMTRKDLSENNIAKQNKEIDTLVKEQGAINKQIDQLTLVPTPANIEQRRQLQASLVVVRQKHRLALEERNLAEQGLPPLKNEIQTYDSILHNRPLTINQSSMPA